MSKEAFKSFARSHPELAKSVLVGNVSWQQLYELYEIYGENNTIWNSYLTNHTVGDTIHGSVSTVKELINTFKNMDMDSIQKGITNIQKAIGLLQDIGTEKGLENSHDKNIPYRRFDD